MLRTRAGPHHCPSAPIRPFRSCALQKRFNRCLLLRGHFHHRVAEARFPMEAVRQDLRRCVSGGPVLPICIHCFLQFQPSSSCHRSVFGPRQSGSSNPRHQIPNPHIQRSCNFHYRRQRTFHIPPFHLSNEVVVHVGALSQLLLGEPRLLAIDPNRVAEDTGSGVERTAVGRGDHEYGWSTGLSPVVALNLRGSNRTAV